MTASHRWVTGILALAAAAASLAVAPGPNGILGALLALSMLAIAIIDMRNFVIPDVLNAGTLALALLYSLVNDWEDGTPAVLEGVATTLARGLALALVFLALRQAFYRLRRRQGLGLGDVKLAGVAGAWLDWAMMPICIEIAALAALAFHLLRQLRRNRGLQASARLPFGAFLAPAIWICWLLQAVLLGSP